MHVVILKVIWKMLYFGTMYRSELNMLLAAELYLFAPQYRRATDLHGMLKSQMCIYNGFFRAAKYDHVQVNPRRQF